jgi:hypothetical protein
LQDCEEAGAEGDEGEDGDEGVEDEAPGTGVLEAEEEDGDAELDETD